MAKSKKDKRILQSAPSLSMRIFGVAAGSFAVGATYLTLTSALTRNAAALCAVFTGVILAALYLLFANKKFTPLMTLGAAVLYTVLCVSIFFQPFVNGAGNFINRIVFTANDRMHWGFPFLRGISPSAGGDFLFCSVLSLWLGFASAALINKSRIGYTVFAVLINLIWLCLGLVAAAYAIVLFVLGIVALLISDRGFTLKAALCHLGIAATVFGALSFGFFYGGSEGVANFKTNAAEAVQNLFYGADDLPNGKLAAASGMRSSRDVRLNVTLAGDMRNLYLRGFVGSTLNGNRWASTDKNVYVSEDYQGLLDYVAAENIPAMQYSRYSELGSGRNNVFPVTVENVSASRKYVYVPYTLSGLNTGYKNYDMNVLGNIFTPRSYTFEVFAGDRSCEGVRQAAWLGNAALQTPEMRQYIAYEEQYRRFAHETYGKGALGGDTESAVRTAMDVTHTDETINSAANIIRNYFETNFTYSDNADQVGDDFVSDFFGGSIKKANAAYFASAATLAFRMYGFAARYAEGYLVYADEGQNEIAVTGNFSHAWAEVYFDGMGWLPIEVTPGFYKDMHEIDPDEPGDPDVPPEPIKPPEETEKPDDKKPELPPEPPEVPLSPAEQKLFTALKVLLPVACVLLAASLTVLGFTVNYTVVKGRRRKGLRQNGEAFGRAAYSIAEKDCKGIGGFSAEKLEEIGIAAKTTNRFLQIIERCVYGGYDLNENERNFVLRYLENVADTIARQKGKWHKFVCRYVKCMGI